MTQFNNTAIPTSHVCHAVTMLCVYNILRCSAIDIVHDRCSVHNVYAPVVVVLQCRVCVCVVEHLCKSGQSFFQLLLHCCVV